MSPRLLTVCLRLATAFAPCLAFAQTVPIPAPAPLAIKPAIPVVAQSLPLSDVRLTGGPLKAAQDSDSRTLLALDADRILFFFRQRAGLEPKAQSAYGGWEGPGRNLTGHIAGHYLSGLCYMFADTGDKQYKDRLDYFISELKAVQEAQKDGYLGALLGNPPAAPRGNAPATAPSTQPAGGPPGRGRGAAAIDGKILFNQLTEGQVRASAFDLNGMWSPWYVEHKIFAGLRDAYRLAGSKDALQVEIKFAAWVDSTLKNLSDQQVQQMLQCEFGGMNEVLADLYADTGEKRWLDLSGKFQHLRVVTPLAEKNDILGGLHGNTQVPKLLGNLKRYIYAGSEIDGNASRFFWDAVVDHHSFATGGHGYDEYFGPPDKLSGQVDGTGQRSNDLRTCESCNVYNMLKMTRTLFSIDPDPKYTEFLERAIFNHYLASIDPDTDRVSYMVPVGLNVNHNYTSGFTCCVGSAYENHALYADAMYCSAPDKLWINLYAPSTARWADAGMTLEMASDFPLGETAALTITQAADGRPRTLSFRRPAWAGEGFAIKVNGTAANDQGKPGTYINIQRAWAKGDTVTLTLPKAVHTEPLPDNPNRMAVLYGPLVLAGDLGPDSTRGSDNGGRSRNAPATPADLVFVSPDKAPAQWLKPVPGQPNTFQAMAANGQTITFTPFFTLTDRRYGLYWDVFTPAERPNR
jgi:uncharacterized protein